ncbi:hypothetical protein [Listeria newyorkensis]|uniref:hypothetical protein n=1 Tax=Listeria newyorkensis TaxID=1497681 RepID=UPI00051DCFA0|nr:hypothetical protein [Listeria newyorkensis]KGL45703.1 hypothetical protein EP58_03150 [Listeria newyorkensis]SQC55365.1 Uncharacterised protein [Listeria newyorkensis]
MNGLEKLEQIDEKRELNFVELTSYLEQYNNLGYWCLVDVEHDAEKSYGSVRDYYSYTLKVLKEKE